MFKQLNLDTILFFIFLRILLILSIITVILIFYLDHKYKIISKKDPTKTSAMNQDQYDAYIANKHNIYTFNENWTVDVNALAKYIAENNIKSEDITEDLINKFIKK